jgi:flagellar biogenesis protein FliO
VFFEAVEIIILITFVTIGIYTLVKIRSYSKKSYENSKVKVSLYYESVLMTLIFRTF